VTGNDIVDLKTAAAESNWKRKGFIEKIFTLQEQQYILDAAVPDEMVWKLWSMKESAYKIYTRQFGGRFFAPLACKCQLLTEFTGSVEINNITCQTTTNITKNYIYSIARSANPAGTEFINCCFPLTLSANSNLQEYMYKKISAHYALVNALAEKNFAVRKDENRIPFLYCKLNKQVVPVSITHHGRYAAFTIN